MPKEVIGGGEAQPKPPNNQASTATEVAYNLTVPVDNDTANVPADMEELAKDVARELDLRLTEAAASAAYQGKIAIVAAKPTNLTPYAEGAIIFVYGTP